MLLLPPINPLFNSTLTTQRLITIWAMLKDQGSLDAAITLINALLNPNYPDAYNNLGNALKDQAA